MGQLARLGRYAVLRKIATGGMAEVFLGKQEGPDGFEKPVALKRILPHLAGEKDLLAMFQEEARIAARLSHPNVVQIFDLGVEEGVPYLALEYVFGESLAQLIERLSSLGKRLPLEAALHVGTNLCLALHHAHHFGGGARPTPIIHRDISPQNVLVGFEGSVKLADFGVAKAKGASKTTTVGLIKGKIGYLSPEQVMGESVDARTDLFALGIVLYEMVAGQPPFKAKGKSMRAIMETVTSEEPPAPPSSCCAGCPRDLDALILKAVEKKRERRFQSAADLLAALEAVQREHALVANSLTMSRLMDESFAQPAAPVEEEPSLLGRIVAYLDARAGGARQPGTSPTDPDNEPTFIRKVDE